VLLVVMSVLYVTSFTRLTRRHVGLSAVASLVFFWGWSIVQQVRGRAGDIDLSDASGFWATTTLSLLFAGMVAVLVALNLAAQRLFRGHRSSAS
jgi:hypothetical protein